MIVKKLTPRGYCHGVVDAINQAIKIAKNPNTKRPIYMLGMIVHNQLIVEALNDIGIITLHSKDKNRLELLEPITEGSIIFTAHGVSPQVTDLATKKGLDIYDATCVDVYKTHEIVESYLDKGYEIIYIGKKNHPEPEGVLGINPSQIHLVDSFNDIETLDISSKDIAVTNQTTMSIHDIFFIMEAIKKKYPNAIFIEEICNATRIRQLAVLEQDEDTDLCIVVGDPSSNNTNKLVELSKNQANINAIRVASVEDIDISVLHNVKKVSVTSGASTPTRVTNEVIQYLETFDPNNPKTPKTNLAISDIIPKTKK